MSESKYKEINILISYAYLRGNGYLQELLHELSPYVNFLVDSGAFTDRWSGIRSHAKGVVYKPVLLSEYIDFCQKFKNQLWQYIALDVIREPQKTIENLTQMVTSGLTPMPVYVEGFTYGILPQLLTINERVCVAGSIGASLNYIQNRYKGIYEASGRKIKIHALGYGRYPEILSANISTADSSSMTSGERFGAIQIFDEITGMRTCSYKKLHLPNSQRNISYIREKMNVPMEVITNRDFYTSKEKYSIPTAVSYLSYMEMSKKCTEAGYKYFFALTLPKNLLTIASILRNKTNNGINYMDFRTNCLSNHKKDEKQIHFIVDNFKDYYKEQK